MQQDNSTKKMTDWKLFEKLEDILRKQNRPNKEIEKIKEVYDFAATLHAGQYRISEDPYIVHPLEVACILADLQADVNTICAALLHDVLEDTDVPPKTLHDKFGEDILHLVNGVTKLGKYSFSSKEERQAENFRKMFVAMAEDIRVIFLKLADRLHNMRTLNYMSPQKQKEIAVETLEVFAPLANRLGMGVLKAELEDLCLRYMNPEKYYEIARLVSESKAERDKTVEAIIDKIQKGIESLDIHAKISGRAKHYYSIYNKMLRSQLKYHELYDITGARIIVDSEKECYEVLGIIHSAFKPIPGRFKDYIAMPKSNMYRSLHTSVIGPMGKPVEIQIRTREMHEIAEFGLAAHWRYKESGSIKAESSEDKKLSWLRKLVEIQQDSTDAREFVDSVKLDLFSDQVFVFTPRGDVIDLPKGATPIDFAYRIHSEVGHKCSGALVNGKIVPLDTKLENGDIIEVLTRKEAKPKLDWLNIVVTNQAKSRIKQWHKKNLREGYIDQAKHLLEAEITKAQFDKFIEDKSFEEIAKQLNYTNAEDMFAALGYGEISVQKIINRLKLPSTKEISIKRPRKPLAKGSKGIVGLEGMLYNIAKCCVPVPGEPIVGVVTRGKGVSVHREDCKNLYHVAPERLLGINWPEEKLDEKTYITTLKVHVIDRIGVLKEIISKISDQKTNIAFASSKPLNKNSAIIEVGIEIKNIEHLNKIINSIQSMKDVIMVKRYHHNNK